MLNSRSTSKPKTQAPDGQAVARLLDQLDVKYFANPAGDFFRAFFDCEHATYEVQVFAMPAKATVLVTVANYLRVSRDHPATDDLMLRLMQINWELALAYFAWRSASERIDIITALRTTDGLSSDTLGRALSWLLGVADRYHRELHEMVEF